MIGEIGGEQVVTVQSTQMPSHSHGVNCVNSGGTQLAPAGNIWAEAGRQRGEQVYASAVGTPQTMNAAVFGLNGGSQPHNNMPPFQTVTFIIALRGIYPARN